MELYNFRNVVWFRLSLALACILRGEFGKIKVLDAQRIQESAGLTGALGGICKNPFNMGYATKRKRWQAGKIESSAGSASTEPTYFAVYSSYFQACWDRLLWDSYNNIKKVSVPDYIFQVSAKGYAVDQNYEENWYRVYKGDSWAWFGTAFWAVWISLSVWLTIIFMKVKRKKYSSYLYLLPWLFMLLVIVKSLIFKKNGKA